MNTLGERRVKVDFNVDSSELVDDIKKKSAELINIAEGMRLMSTNDESLLLISSEKARLIALAQTAYEDACMWLVKANYTE